MILLETPRLKLRDWREPDREAFAAMVSDPEVMHDWGGPLSRSESDAKMDRYADAVTTHGFGRWLLEDSGGQFLGYRGVMPGWEGHPLGSHYEIGWRLVRRAWGHGYATEAARAALDDAFGRVELEEVLAYTTADNARSQSVMKKLKLQRDPARDFAAHNDRVGTWGGLVWVAHPESPK